MLRTCAFRITLFAFSACAVLAQMGFSGGGGPGANGVYQGMAMFARPSGSFAAVTGAPYSGQRVTESVQTLADGTHVTRSFTGDMVWRDSQGRTRVEHPMMPAASDGTVSSPTVVQITDPVAGYQYTMDTVNKVVHRVAITVQPVTLPSAAPSRAPVPSVVAALPVGPVRAGGSAQSTPQRPQASVETLGNRMVEGVSANGIRHTTVFPAGTQNNDAPITVSAEQWYSPELRLDMLSITDDPRSGLVTSKMANFSRTEPDPALFVVPPDYNLVDETSGFFRISWGVD